MKVCPNCGKVIGFNSYFGAYICENCKWEDDSYNQKRISYYANAQNEEGEDIDKETPQDNKNSCLCYR